MDPLHLQLKSEGKRNPFFKAQSPSRRSIEAWAIKRCCEDVDRISSLPDDILSFILSLLSFKDAAKLRLLSRRWRYLVPSAKNLNFDMSTVIGIDEPWRVDMSLSSLHRSRFLMIVDKIMHNKLAAPFIDSFRVRFLLGKESASHIDNWISLASEMDAKSIEVDTLSASAFEQIDQEPYSFPLHLLPQSKKLSRLSHLRICSCLFTPTFEFSDKLYSLKSLELRRVELSQHDIDVTFSACVNLESLTFEECIFAKNTCIQGQLCRRLNTLLISILGNWALGTTIEINCLKKLQTVEYVGMPLRLSVSHVPSLKKMYLRIFGGGHKRRKIMIDELARDVPPLSTLSTYMIDCDEVGSILTDLSMFKNLKELDLYMKRPNTMVAEIVGTINRLPLLQKLHLTLDEKLEGSWNELHNVSKINLGLKEVYMYNFREIVSHMAAASYLLKNAIVLERMLISSKWRSRQEVGKLWSFPTHKFVHLHSPIGDVEKVRELLLNHVVGATDIIFV